MDKLTYLAELAEGLARWVPERERQDILRYYAEYFEEAGPGREAEVVAELGDPWALSCRLAVEGGFVTQEQANAWRPPMKKRKLWPWVAAGTAAVLVFVIGSSISFASRVGRLVGQAVSGTTAVSTPYVEAAFGDTVVNVEEAPGFAFSQIPEDDAAGFWNGEDGTLEEFSTIDVDISLGNIMVTGGEDYTLFISRGASLAGDYDLSWKVVDGVLKIRDGGSGKGSGWGGLKTMFQEGSYTMELVITVPAEVDKIDVKTGLGDVHLSNLFARIKAEAETKLGNVECYEVRTPKTLDLKSDLGNVTLSIDELYDGMDIELEADLGNVEAGLGCREQDCEYELEADLGGVSVNGVDRGSKAEQKGKLPYKLDAESSLGDVDVYFTEDLQGRD